jgi:hypothetical protein
VAGPDQEDVAVTDGHPMGPLGGFELLAEHVLAGLQPGHTPQPGMSSSTPRPTRPSLRASMPWTAAPREVISTAGWPLYRLPSKATWHSASMWL